jgi:antirestriction protein ArdC
MSALYQSITAQIVAQLEQGAAPWIKPWATDTSADRNLVTNKPYRGINRLLLGMSSMAAGYSSPVWATFQQWKAAGANVRKGEKATHIVFFKPVSKDVVSESGETEKESYAVIKGYCVFNAAQVDGLEIPAPVSAVTEFERHERAELTIVKTGAVIRHGGDAAFYAPSVDAIQMPNRAAFHGPANYYATAFHELTHWTGAKHRLDRDLDKGRYGNPAYAFEELVAEMGAAFMCADHGIQGELRHAGYIASWIKALRENDRAIFKASALAQKAADYLLAIDATQERQAA